MEGTLRNVITGLRQAAIVFAGSFAAQAMQSTVEMNVGTVSMASAVIVLGVVALVAGWSTLLGAVTKERNRDADRTRQRIEEHRARLRRLYRDARQSGRWTAGNAQEWQNVQAEIRALMGDLASREKAIPADSIDDMLPPPLELAPRAASASLHRAEAPTAEIHEPARQARRPGAGTNSVARVSGLMVVALMGVTSSHGVGRIVQGEAPSLAMVRRIWDVDGEGTVAMVSPSDRITVDRSLTVASDTPLAAATVVERADSTDVPPTPGAPSPTLVAMLAATSIAEPTRVALVADGGAMATADAPPSEYPPMLPPPPVNPEVGAACDDGIELLEPVDLATIGGRVAFRWTTAPEISGPYRVTVCIDGTDDCTDLETVEPFLEWCPDRGANTYRWHVTSVTTNHGYSCAEGRFAWREGPCP